MRSSEDISPDIVPWRNSAGKLVIACIVRPEVGKPRVEGQVDLSRSSTHAHARAYTRAVSSFDTLIVHRWRERCSTCSSKPSLRGSSVLPGPPSPLLVVSQEMVRVWLIFSSVSEPPGLERDELETEKGGREDPVN